MTSLLKKALPGLMGFAVFLLASASAWAYQPGEWVLAKYKNGPYWYPGVVQADNNGRISVAYDDGDRETLPSSQVKNYSWQVGTRVQCNWKGGGKWFAGRITALKGAAVSIHYDDGDKENTATGRCRST